MEIARLLRRAAHPSLVALLCLVVFAATLPRTVTPARAALAIQVDRGVTEPIPIAIPDFLGAGTAGKDVATVVRADLERSGLFRSLNPTSFIEKISDINTPPRFGDWRTIQA